ncbi:LamG-like jellyroll fold domain-containing protein [Thalassobellus citreus]|uniref:LamG-like jellyroll fold domain-containing protein n=1 Tax=Thalassobellus citreus TaxID=3367752 RepID=UPI0037897819
MRHRTLSLKAVFKIVITLLLTLLLENLNAQTLAFPEATGFGRYTTGARGYVNPQIYLVTNLNDSGAGSFRDAVSQEGRFVIFKVGGIINLQSQIVVAKNTTIAGQTATGEGIVLAGPRVTFTGASNTISRYIRIRYVGGAKNQDASGLSNGANMIFDHMTVTWGTDEVFSINWDGKGTSPDNITIQNSIIGQGLHRHNHSAGGLMQPSDGKISLIGNLYISNKTRNPKVKGINEFVNNVVYNWGNYGNTYGHTESGDAYIMGGDSAGTSEVNIINNYFIGGPHTNNSLSTPFNRGNSNFFLYGSGNYFDNNKNGTLDGTLVSEDLTGYPTGNVSSLQLSPYDYPVKNASLTAQESFDKVVLDVGASYPRRDQVDSLMIDNLVSKGTEAFYVYRETDLPFINGGLGHVYAAPSPLDTDNDGMPDAWEDNNGLNKNNASDALAVSITNSPYLNIEVYINGLVNETPPEFIIPPSNVNFTNLVSTDNPSSSLTVNWSDIANNEDNNIIERSIDGSNFIVIGTLGENSTSFNDTGLVPNTKYYYRVKATNSSDSSAYSEVKSVTTPLAPSDVVPQKMVGYWPFNEAPLDGQQVTDNTAYENHGILDSNFDNASVRVLGKIGNALDFSTSNDATYMVSISNQDQIYFDESSFSISFWMQATPSLLPQGSNSVYLLCKGSFGTNTSTGSTGKRYNIEFKGGQFRFAVDDNVTKKELSSDGAPFFTGNWEHVVVMRDVTAHKLRVYLNGVFIKDLDETGVTGIAEVSDFILGNIGELELLNGTSPAPYKGKLDELKVFNHALSASDVTTLYQNSLSSKEFNYNKNDIKVYPNPINNQINIKIPAYNKPYLTTTLKDVTGKVIIKEKLNVYKNGHFVLNIANKKLSGIYILNIFGENLNMNLRIVAD